MNLGDESLYILAIWASLPLVGFFVSILIGGCGLLRSRTAVYCGAYYGILFAPYIIMKATGREIDVLQGMGCAAILLGPFLAAYFAAEGFRWRELKAGKNSLLCQNCKYDLRGNTSGICPECGAVISHEQEQYIASMPNSIDPKNEE